MGAQLILCKILQTIQFSTFVWADSSGQIENQRNGKLKIQDDEKIKLEVMHQKEVENLLELWDKEPGFKLFGPTFWHKNVKTHSDVKDFVKFSKTEGFEREVASHSQLKQDTGEMLYVRVQNKVNGKQKQKEEGKKEKLLKQHQENKETQEMLIQDDESGKWSKQHEEKEGMFPEKQGMETKNQERKMEREIIETPWGSKAPQGQLQDEDSEKGDREGKEELQNEEQKELARAANSREFEKGKKQEKIELGAGMTRRLTEARRRLEKERKEQIWEEESNNKELIETEALLNELMKEGRLKRENREEMGEQSRRRLEKGKRKEEIWKEESNDKEQTEREALDELMTERRLKREKKQEEIGEESRSRLGKRRLERERKQEQIWKEESNDKEQIERKELELMEEIRLKRENKPEEIGEESRPRNYDDSVLYTLTKRELPFSWFGWGSNATPDQSKKNVFTLLNYSKECKVQVRGCDKPESEILEDGTGRQTVLKVTRPMTEQELQIHREQEDKRWEEEEKKVEAEEERQEELKRLRVAKREQQRGERQRQLAAIIYGKKVADKRTEDEMAKIKERKRAEREKIRQVRQEAKEKLRKEIQQAKKEARQSGEKNQDEFSDKIAALLEKQFSDLDDDFHVPIKEKDEGKSWRWC